MIMSSNNKTVIAIIQARMGSSRLPGKVLMDLSGLPVLGWITRAAEAITSVSNVVVATSQEVADDPIANWCKKEGVTVYRGDEHDVLSRFHKAAKAENADVIIRLTGDCPFLDPHVCSQVLALFDASNADYANNASLATWPDGLDCEVIARNALDVAFNEAKKTSEREHVAPFIYNRHSRFKCVNMICPVPGLEKERWTLDTKFDFKKLQLIASALPNDRAPNFLETLNISRTLPTKSHQEDEARNAGYSALRANENTEQNENFDRSNSYLQRSLETVPIGSQTFSKSHLQYPQKESPLFASHGRGGRIWDVDGNEYVDLICGLMPVVLGYCDQDVDAAIRSQLNNGVTFSLATELEAKLAEKLVEIIPCAEKVRFGKNGTDVTSAAIRLARAFTKRDRVMVAGYHGWQDWYIGSTTRHLGVPQGVRDLTHSVAYNNLQQVEQLLNDYPGEFAGMILEPMNIVEPEPDYLGDLKSLLHKHGAVMIFDEIVTGFHFALGGAQELFGVTPDLAAFGKAMGNGMPISAIVGREDIMQKMEDIFFSGTFGGESLSLAASLAVIEKMQREPVVEKLWQTGEIITKEVTALIRKYNLSEVIKLHGRAPWVVLEFKDCNGERKEAIKTYYMRQMLRNGVLTQGSHNICYAHDNRDISKVVNAYDITLSSLEKELDMGGLESRLPGGAIEAIFRVR